MVQFYSCVEKRQHVETKVVWSRFLGISLVLFLLFLWTETSVKSQKKELGQHPAILTSRLVKTHMNIFYADPYNSGKGREFKKCTSEPGIFLTHKSMDFLFLVIRFMRC